MEGLDVYIDSIKKHWNADRDTCKKALSIFSELYALSEHNKSLESIQDDLRSKVTILNSEVVRLENEKLKLTKSISATKRIAAKKLVYFIQFGSGPIKIGATTNIKTRMSALKKTTSESLKLLGTLDGSLFKERELHDQFQNHKLYSELFNPDQELLKFISEQTTLRKD